MSDEVYWSLGIQLSHIDRYWQILSILTRCAAITDTGFITKLALFIGVCYLFSQIERAETHQQRRSWSGLRDKCVWSTAICLGAALSRPILAALARNRKDST